MKTLQNENFRMLGHVCMSLDPDSNAFIESYLPKGSRFMGSGVDKKPLASEDVECVYTFMFRTFSLKIFDRITCSFQMNA